VITALQEQLRQPYTRDLWSGLLPRLLPGRVELFRAALEFPLTAGNQRALATGFRQLGRAVIPDGQGDEKILAVFEVSVAPSVDLLRNRVALRELVARGIDEVNAHAVLAFFVSPGNSAYRLTYAAKESRFGENNQVVVAQTAARRYTYVLGPGDSRRTAASQLARLSAMRAKATLKDVTDTFAIEPLFREFFRDYGRIFDQVEDLVRATLPDKEPLRMFTQRLFNRLMFLAFIERKGWLRYDARTDYLAALWATRNQSAGANFYRDRLVPLFFAGLNNAARPPGQADPRFGTVPYLNGGLFEKADDGTDDQPDLIVPDAALRAILDADDGLFARYNFTVAESTPLDVEVAVDPEMLGKVFEELVTGRHEQGSYYTPKPIVSFMCREALVGHLASRCEKESRAALETFVHDHEPKDLRDAEGVLRALRAVTVCDPACGSGAYLLGMLHELLDLRTCLFAANQKLDGRTAHERKLEIIECNLYGVDKDPFAVNIARLRLWLSLAVEYDGTQPPPALPNLDFKIEQGDSLAAPAPSDVLRDAGNLPLLLPTVRDFSAKKAKFLTAHGAAKEALRAEIITLKQSLKTWLATEGPADAFHWALEFAEVFLPAPAVASITGGLNLGLELAPAATPGGFDIVVANPPYVRMELIKPQKPVLRKRFPHVHAERADLYVYFYARAHDLLRDGGTAAFISSNKWLRAGYGESLRQHLLDAQAFGVVMDFGELPVFEAAATDAAIFIWKKEPRSESATRWAMVKDLDRCFAEGVRAHFLGLTVPVPAAQFGKDKPRLATSATADFRKRMEKSGPRLGEVCKGLLGWGIKTGLNDAFIISQEKRDELITETPAAADIIKPLLVGDDIRRYESHFRGKYLIYTHHDLDIQPYKSVRDWLSNFRNLPPKKDGSPRGLDHRATQQEWYELQQPQRAYEPLFVGPKIAYPDIGKECRFFLDTEGRYVEATAFVIGSADPFILGVLNSKLAFTYFQELCAVLGDKDDGGRLRFKTQYIENLPIPAASAAERVVVGGLAERTQALHGLRRARVERFLRDLGVDPAASTSRNPLEQPWSLPPAEFAKRAKPLQRVARERPQLLYESARDETAALTEQIAKLEATIDARVAALYGLDAEDQRWAAKAAPAAQADDKSTLFFRLLGDLKFHRPYFSLKAIQASANDAELALKDSTLKGYLVEAVAQGLVHDAGRGWYSRLAKPFVLNAKPVAGLVKTMEKAFPLLDYTCWSTEQIQGYGHHLLTRFAAFVHTDRDAMASVGDRLRDEGWDVSVNPRGAAAQEFAIRGDRTVIIRPRTTTQPSEGRLVAIEGLLVELFIESKTLNLMDTGEYFRMLVNLVAEHRIRIATLLDYAKERRPVGLELNEHIKADIIKYSVLAGSSSEP
jgi:hypothetical protein